MGKTRTTKKQKPKAIHRWLRYFVPICIVAVIIVFGIIGWMASAASDYKIQSEAAPPTLLPLSPVPPLPTLINMDPLRPDTFDSREFDKLVNLPRPSRTVTNNIRTAGSKAVTARQAVLESYRYDVTNTYALSSQERDPLIMSLAKNIDRLVKLRRQIEKESDQRTLLNLTKKVYAEHVYGIVVPRLQGQVAGLIGQRMCKRVSGYASSMANKGNRDLYSLTLDESNKFYDLSTKMKPTCTTYDTAVNYFKALKNSNYPADRAINDQTKALSKANSALIKQRAELTDLVAMVEARHVRDRDWTSVTKIIIATPWVNITAGETLQMKAQFVMDNGTVQIADDCAWGVEGDPIGSVDNHGLLTTTNAGGQATVKVSCMYQDKIYITTETITAMTLEANPNAGESIFW